MQKNKHQLLLTVQREVNLLLAWVAKCGILLLSGAKNGTGRCSVVLITMAVCVSACAHTFTKPGATQAQVDKIVKECRYEGMKHQNWKLGQGGADNLDITRACLDLKGVKVHVGKVKSK